MVKCIFCYGKGKIEDTSEGNKIKICPVCDGKGFKNRIGDFNG